MSELIVGRWSVEPTFQCASAHNTHQSSKISAVGIGMSVEWLHYWFALRMHCFICGYSVQTKVPVRKKKNLIMMWVLVDYVFKIQKIWIQVSGVCNVFDWCGNFDIMRFVASVIILISSSKVGTSDDSHIELLLTYQPYPEICPYILLWSDSSFFRFVK